MNLLSNSKIITDFPYVHVRDVINYRVAKENQLYTDEDKLEILAKYRTLLLSNIESNRVISIDNAIAMLRDVILESHDTLKHSYRRIASEIPSLFCNPFNCRFSVLELAYFLGKPANIAEEFSDPVDITASLKEEIGLEITYEQLRSMVVDNEPDELVEHSLDKICSSQESAENTAQIGSKEEEPKVKEEQNSSLISQTNDQTKEVEIAISEPIQVVSENKSQEDDTNDSSKEDVSEAEVSHESEDDTNLYKSEKAVEITSENETEVSTKPTSDTQKKIEEFYKKNINEDVTKLTFNEDGNAVIKYKKEDSLRIMKQGANVTREGSGILFESIFILLEQID